MASAAVSESEVLSILAAPKAITQDVVWSRKNSAGHLETRLNVTGAFQGSLMLVVVLNANLRARYGFALVLNKGSRISGLDMNNSHRNK